MTECALCRRIFKGRLRAMWHLNNYHGISGQFCASCYQKVAHTAFDKPKHPVAYRIALKKLNLVGPYSLPPAGLTNRS